MKKDRKYTLYLEDILLSMTRIQEYISLTNAECFETNHLIVDAVVRNFEVIGEAASARNQKQLSANTLETNEHLAEYHHP